MDGFKKKLLLMLGPSIASGFLLLFTVFIAVFIVLGIFDGNGNKSGDGTVVKGDNTIIVCDNKTAQLLSMIVYKEVGNTSLFAKLNTASIVLNNAGGDTYDKIYALSDNTYAGFSSYKDSSFNDVVPSASQGEMLYVAEAVLSGKYNLPKNITLQASQDIVTQYGNVWTYVSASPMDVYFGYSDGSLDSTDIFGNVLSSEAYSSIDDSVSYYTSLANTISKSNYSSYDTSSICKSSGSSCGFTISSTSLSKAEFKNKLTGYASSTGSHKSDYQFFADNSDNIYDIAVANNINPELVVVRASTEGFSPGSDNNYWGIGCTNTGGKKACKSYSSFGEGVKAFVNNVSQYSSLHNMMSKYAYIGKYWYNPGSSSIGGCYYSSYIYNSNNMPDRVKNACSYNADTCTRNGESACVPTTDDDQTAYANWQVNNMTRTHDTIFGASSTSSCVSNISADVTSIINLTDSEAWLALTGTSTNYKNVSKSTMDSRVTTITVPIRAWSSSNSSDKSTKKVEKTLTVNKALAQLYTEFFTDIYNNAPDFIIEEVACYNYRATTNSTSLSAHAYGAACDINWSTTGNGYGATVYNKTTWNSLSESKSKYQVIYSGSKVVEIAHKYTLSWGGEWNSVTDAMHFSFIKDKTREYLKSEFGGNL